MRIIRDESDRALSAIEWRRRLDLFRTHPLNIQTTVTFYRSW